MPHNVGLIGCEIQGQGQDDITFSFHFNYLGQECSPTEDDLKNHLTGLGFSGGFSNGGLSGQVGYSPGDGKFDFGVGVSGAQAGGSGTYGLQPTRGHIKW